MAPAACELEVDWVHYDINGDSDDAAEEAAQAAPSGKRDCERCE